MGEMLQRTAFSTLFYMLQSKEKAEVVSVKSTGDRLGRWERKAGEPLGEDKG